MYSRKKRVFVTLVMAIMMAGLVGCGKSAEDVEQAGASVVEAEDLPTPEDDAERAEGRNLEEPEGGEADAQASGQGSGEGEPASAAEEENTFHYIKEDKDLYGDIWEVGEGQFTVIEIYTDKTDDGGDIMVELAPGTDAQEEAAKITIVYDENTKFIKQKIWDGGAGHEEKEGSAADLQKGLTAEMNGSYEGDVFHATEILIVEVILD